MDKKELYEELEKYPDTMTASQRISAYMSGEVADHLPYDLFDVPQLLSEACGYSIKRFYEDFDMFVEMLQMAEREFGLAGASFSLNLRAMGAAMGSVLEYPEHRIDFVKEHILKDGYSWEKLIEIDPYNNHILTPHLNRAKKLRETHPEIGVSSGVKGPISVASAVRPIESLLRDLRKRPDDVRKLLDIIVDNNLKWVQAWTNEFGPQTMAIADPVTCADILSEKQYVEFSLPAQKKMIEGIYKITGNKPILHICGHSKPLWKHIHDLPLFAFSADNCEDLEECKNILGDKMAIIGNVPPVDIFRMGQIDDVINNVKECIQKAGDAPNGYIPCSGCDVPFETPLENLKAFVYAVRKYGKNAVKGKMPEGML